MITFGRRAGAPLNAAQALTATRLLRVIFEVSVAELMPPFYA
jgi:hypothetical protein